MTGRHVLVRLLPLVSVEISTVSMPISIVGSSGERAWMASPNTSGNTCGAVAPMAAMASPVSATIAMISHTAGPASGFRPSAGSRRIGPPCQRSVFRPAQR
jgi:hypothetical protein